MTYMLLLYLQTCCVLARHFNGLTSGHALPAATHQLQVQVTTMQLCTFVRVQAMVVTDMAAVQNHLCICRLLLFLFWLADNLSYNATQQCILGPGRQGAFEQQ